MSLVELDILLLAKFALINMDTNEIPTIFVSQPETQWFSTIYLYSEHYKLDFCQLIILKPQGMENCPKQFYENKFCRTGAIPVIMVDYLNIFIQEHY